MNNGQSNARVEWSFKAVGSNADPTAYRNSTMLLNEDRWSVRNNQEHSELIITGAKPKDAGRFTCLTAEGESHSTYLVILGNHGEA